MSLRHLGRRVPREPRQLATATRRLVLALGRWELAKATVHRAEREAREARWTFLALGLDDDDVPRPECPAAIPGRTHRLGARADCIDCGPYLDPVADHQGGRS